MIRCRMSGLRIGGSGIEMSSNAMVSRIPGLQQLRQRLGRRAGAAARARIAPSTSRIAGQRLRRVDDARSRRELLQPEALALVDDQRRGPVVDLQHETGAAHAASPCSGRRPP